MLPIHTTPDSKNVRADRTIAKGCSIAQRVGRQTREEAMADLVPSQMSAEDFVLAWGVAVVLAK